MSNEITKVLTELTPTLMRLVGLNYRGYSENELMAIVEQQLDFFNERAMLNPVLFECTPESVKFGIRKALNYNLSLDRAADQVYMIPNNVNIGTKQNPQWVKVLDCPNTVNGDLSISYQCGTIIDHKIPTVKYEPSKTNSEKLQVCEVIVHLRKPTGEWEDTSYKNDFFKRLMEYSHTKNGRGKQDADINKLNYANDKYRAYNGWIDPAFASTKALKHRLKKLGNNMNAKRNGVIKTFEPLPSEPENELMDNYEIVEQ